VRHGVLYSPISAAQIERRLGLHIQQSIKFFGEIQLIPKYYNLTAPDQLMRARLVPKVGQVKRYFGGFAVLEQACGGVPSLMMAFSRSLS
jgi:hypothetical protein